MGKNCKSGEVLISAEFIPQAELQKRIQLEPSKSIDKQEDTKKISETTKQDTFVESSQEEVLIQKDVQIESTTAKGGKGLKDILNREKKVSSETIVKPDQSIEPEVIIPKPREVEPGLISVTVHKARDIEKNGMFGKADPYVIMTHGDQKAKSKTIKNNYNPEWEFNAKFNIKKDAAEGIKISVFDDDIGKDDALGMKVLDIGSVQDYQQLKNQWIPLENCKSGEVLISAEFTPQALVEEAEKSVVVQSPEAETKDVAKADPYVHITLGKQKAKSKTVKNNHNPEWNFDATFEVDQNTPETMRVDVFDEDLGKDDILGHKVLDISTVLEKKKLENEWIPLDNCKSGEILLSAEFIPIANIQQSKQVEEHVEEQPTPDKPEEKDTKPKETVQDSEKSIPAVQTSEKPKEEMMTTDSAPSKPKRKLESGQIHLTVIKAKDIEKKGKFGKADPYVKITYGKQKAKSKTVKNNHNPEWNFEATFDIDENSSEGLNIAVFDDDFGKDDSLGNKTMDIIDIQENMKVLNKWIPLENCKSGEVLLSAEFIPQASIQKAVDKSKAVDAKPIEENKEQIGAEIKEKIVVQDTTVVKQVVEEPEAAKSIKPEREEETKEGKQKSSKATKIKESQESGTAPVSTPNNILEPGQVVLTVYKARDIEKKGKFGKADPYVKMTLGEQKAKSATVKNNHNPEWNFKATFDIHESATNEVSIELFDEDFGKDDTLGSTVLDLSQIQEQKQLLNQGIPLKNCKSGEVLISAEFIPQAELQKRIQLEPSKSIDKQEDTKKI